MAPREIVGSRVKTCIYLLGCLAFVAAAAFASDGGTDHLAVWSGVFFAFCATVFVWQLIRPQRLLLDNNGFALEGGFMFSPRRIAWKDVSGFFLVHVRYSTTMIGYNFSNTVMKPRGKGAARRLSGADGAIHGVWPVSNSNMADELNQYRDRAVRGVTARIG